MVRMTVPTMFVISMAVASAIMAGSGFTAWAGAGYDPGLGGAADDLRSQAEFENGDDGEDGLLEGPSIPNSLDLLGLAVRSIQIIIDTFYWVFLFPFALMNIGFPGWFAVPVGLPVLYVNLIGTAQILRGMNIR